MSSKHHDTECDPKHGHEHGPEHEHHDHDHHVHHDHDHYAHHEHHDDHDHHEHAHSHDHHDHHAHVHDHHEHSHPHSSAQGGTILTVRPASGLSGDMMLAGLAAVAGLTTESLQTLVDELRLPALQGCLQLEARSVHSIAGVGCRIDLPHEHAHRTVTDIHTIIANSAMPDDAKQLSTQAFTLLATAEAAVHGSAFDAVTFHEVGALDSILDTCLVCRIFTLLKVSRCICSPLPIADGTIHCAHGRVPSPAPAVLRLLEGVPVCGFSGSGETVTPTAISLLKALGVEFGAWPAMTIRKTAISYGTKVFADAPNGAVWALGDI